VLALTPEKLIESIIEKGSVEKSKLSPSVAYEELPVIVARQAPFWPPTLTLSTFENVIVPIVSPKIN